MVGGWGSSSAAAAEAHQEVLRVRLPVHLCLLVSLWSPRRSRSGGPSGVQQQQQHQQFRKSHPCDLRRLGVPRPPAQGAPKGGPYHLLPPGGPGGTGGSANVNCELSAGFGYPSQSAGLVSGRPCVRAASFNRPDLTRTPPRGRPFFGWPVLTRGGAWALPMGPRAGRRRATTHSP